MWIGIAALNLALAVMLGAFGAHGLQKIANAQQITWWHSTIFFDQNALFTHSDWYRAFLQLFIYHEFRHATYLGCDHADWWIFHDTWLVGFGLASL